MKKISELHYLNEVPKFIAFSGSILVIGRQKTSTLHPSKLSYTLHRTAL